jgi:predicted hotdog family 3-hydroxylacyl-ACP dehydratase
VLEHHPTERDHPSDKDALARPEIAALVPHAGAMCLLDRVLSWDAESILCAARSHLDPANPLRRGGRLAALCGLEYALQAAALHGALRDGWPQPAGCVASLRDVVLHVARLDDPAHGELRVAAALEQGDSGGLLYALRVDAEQGAPLVLGRAVIALPRGPA